LYSRNYKFEFPPVKYLSLHRDVKEFSMPEKNIWTPDTVRNSVGWRKLVVFIKLFSVDTREDEMGGPRSTYGTTQQVPVS
jgi:hypothetical protein